MMPHSPSLLAVICMIVAALATLVTAASVVLFLVTRD
jgi:hypothetical protein